MKIKDKLKISLLAALSIIMAIMLILDSRGVSQAVISCTGVCLNSLIPSLFGYMVLCTMLTQSGLGDLIFKPLWYIFRRIIKLDSRMFSVFMMSQIAGYPVGVRLISTLIAQNNNYNEISEKCSFFCYNSGPAFIVGMVGLTVYNSALAGMLIFVSCLLSNFIMAIFFTRKFPQQRHVSRNSLDLGVSTVKSSLMSTGYALLAVCLSMILFNTVPELIRCAGYDMADGKIINTILMSVWEVTNIKNSGALLPLPIAAALISFGGLCVIFQVITLCDYKLNVGKFIAARAVSALLSGGICFLLTAATGYSTAIQTGSIYTPGVLMQNPIVAVCILAMTFILLSYRKYPGGLTDKRRS